MKCPNCKTTGIPDDAKFCPSCGQPLLMPAQKEKSQQELRDKLIIEAGMAWEANPQKPKKIINPYTIIMIIISFIGVSLMYYLAETTSEAFMSIIIGVDFIISIPFFIALVISGDKFEKSERNRIINEKAKFIKNYIDQRMN